MISFIICLLTFILVFNYTLFYFDDDDDEFRFYLRSNKWFKYLKILSPILLLFLFFLLYYEFISIINGRSSIDGSLSYLIGLFICVGSGVSSSFYIIYSYNLPTKHKFV